MPLWLLLLLIITEQVSGFETLLPSLKIHNKVDVESFHILLTNSILILSPQKHNFRQDILSNIDFVGHQFFSNPISVEISWLFNLGLIPHTCHCVESVHTMLQLEQGKPYKHFYPRVHHNHYCYHLVPKKVIRQKRQVDRYLLSIFLTVFQSGLSFNIDHIIK